MRWGSTAEGRYRFKRKMRNNAQSYSGHSDVIRDVRIVRSGQALVESMVALCVLTMGFLGVMGLLARSLSVSRVAADEYVGANLASEGIEIVKNLIDAHTIQELPWSGGFEHGKDYELDYRTDWDSAPLPAYGDNFLNYDSETHLYGYATGQPSRFKRRITIVRPSADEVVARSVVTWITRGGAEFSVDVEDHFYNWRE